MFSLQSIVLSESNFKRELHVDLSSEHTEGKVQLDLDHHIDDEKNLLRVELAVKFESIIKEKTQFFIYAKIIGSFAFSPNEPLPVKDFAKVNAPAILFPFVREHIASIALKAGLGSLLLPPVNFVQLNQGQTPEP